jgi:hypothetical protein
VVVTDQADQADQTDQTDQTDRHLSGRTYCCGRFSARAKANRR